MRHGCLSVELQTLVVRDRCNFFWYPTHWAQALALDSGHLTLSRSEEECLLVMMDSELGVLACACNYWRRQFSFFTQLRAGLISWEGEKFWQARASAPEVECPSVPGRGMFTLKKQPDFPMCLPGRSALQTLPQMRLSVESEWDSWPNSFGPQMRILLSHAG